MSTKRRYHDAEVEEIFALATQTAEAGPLALPSHDGLTLEELQEVGAQVGLPPERIAAAASAVDVRGETLPQRTHMGQPLSVGRVVDLPRAATDREWELLVAELRATFDAKGEVTSHGSLREWSNGNLHAFHEPTDDGYRLRMTTFREVTYSWTAMGSMFLVMSVIMFVAMASKGKLGLELVLPMFFGAAGIGALASNMLQLPRWAREREQQMEHIAERARTLLEASTADDDAE